MTELILFYGNPNVNTYLYIQVFVEARFYETSRQNIWPFLRKSNIWCNSSLLYCTGIYTSLIFTLLSFLNGKFRMDRLMTFIQATVTLKVIRLVGLLTAFVIILRHVIVLFSLYSRSWWILQIFVLLDTSRVFFLFNPVLYVKSAAIRRAYMFHKHSLLDMNSNFNFV